MLRTSWLGECANVKNDLFNAQGGPNFLLTVDVWKPLIRTYFAWFSIPRSQCTRIWGDIVDCLLKLPDGSMDAVFQSWAFGCLCKFHLEDRKMRETASRDEYDPEKPIVIKED